MKRRGEPWIALGVRELQEDAACTALGVRELQEDAACTALGVRELQENAACTALLRQGPPRGPLRYP